MKNYPQTPAPTFESVWTALQETDRQMKENDCMLTEKFAKTEKLISDMQKEIGGVSNSNNKIAESYFINSFENSMYFAGQEYDSLAHNLRKKSKKMNKKDEFDLVLYNCSSVALIEIKYNAQKKHVEQALTKVESFKTLFPEYKDFAMYLGLAGLHVDEDAEQEAIAFVPVAQLDCKNKKNIHFVFNEMVDVIFCVSLCLITN